MTPYYFVVPALFEAIFFACPMPWQFGIYMSRTGINSKWKFSRKIPPKIIRNSETRILRKLLRMISGFALANIHCVVCLSN